MECVQKLVDNHLPWQSPENSLPVVSIFERGYIDGVELDDSFSSKTGLFLKGFSKYMTKSISFGKEESMLCNFGTKCWLVKITFGPACWIPYLKNIMNFCFRTWRYFFIKVQVYPHIKDVYLIPSVPRLVYKVATV